MRYIAAGPSQTAVLLPHLIFVLPLSNFVGSLAAYQLCRASMPHRYEGARFFTESPALCVNFGLAAYKHNITTPYKVQRYEILIE